MEETTRELIAGMAQDEQVPPAPRTLATALLALTDRIAQLEQAPPSFSQTNGPAGDEPSDGGRPAHDHAACQMCRIIAKRAAESSWATAAQTAARTAAQEENERVLLEIEASLLHAGREGLVREVNAAHAAWVEAGKPEQTRALVNVTE